MTIAPTDEELAFHEAGHSVIRILLGGAFNRVSIVRHDPAQGARTVQTSMNIANGTAAVRDRVAVLPAGEAAQHLHDCQHPRQAGSNDREQAEVAAASVTQDTDAFLETELFVHAAWLQACELLDDERTWRRVECVARALLTRHAIDGDDVRRLCLATT